jgi:hypothetical protein
MSKYMLSDSNTMNKINPFVMSDFSLPGGWSEPKPYSDDVTTPPPICSEGISAGDRASDVCSVMEPNCPMSRLLEPTREYDYDIIKEVSKKKNNKMTMSLSETEPPNYVIYIIIAVVLIALMDSK